jgi:hypothetical protein
MFLNRAPRQPSPPLTVEQIEIRIWAFVVIVVMLVFAGITGSLLYSVIFVTQPIKSMAPIDQAFTKMLNDIVLLIVGGIGGIMSKKGVHAVAEAIATPQPPSPQQVAAAPSLSPAPAASSGLFNFDFNNGYKNPELDETWTPGPPPTTPPNYVDPAAEEIANERAAAKLEAA